MINGFTNHQQPLAILRQKAKEAFGKSCELKKAGATRVGTNTFVGERLIELSNSLQQITCSAAWLWVVPQLKSKPLPKHLRLSQCSKNAK